MKNKKKGYPVMRSLEKQLQLLKFKNITFGNIIAGNITSLVFNKFLVYAERII